MTLLIVNAARPLLVRGAVSIATTQLETYLGALRQDHCLVSRQAKHLHGPDCRSSTVRHCLLRCKLLFLAKALRGRFDLLLSGRLLAAVLVDELIVASILLGLLLHISADSLIANKVLSRR